MKKIITFLFLLLIVSEISYTQNTRKVLFEEGTNASCGPCAANNPILDAFLVSNAANVMAIKYHASWPGYDPMYQLNPTQNTERIVNYYNMNATGVPYCNCDGIIQDIWPFSNSAFTNAMNTRLAVLTPLSVTVQDQRIAGDSVKSTITLTLANNLPAGTYKLRIFAIERVIQYATPPGNNGETVFKDVFRRAYPNTTGVDIVTTAGTQQFVYKYKREPQWMDTSLVTIAFVQNDVNKEVINVGRGTYIATSIFNLSNEIPSAYKLWQNYPNPFNPVTNIRFSLKEKGFTSLKIYNSVGQEVANLLNQDLNPGTYEKNFDASFLSSGIYFYRLISGSYSETKKMNLIK
ncbi:MAG: T9SS type A sorting domain-containing protein [Ignavibacteria bacterium]|nr:T9SS type A sorting domain-containing protein [Ignavibacteria bacterium]